MRLPPFIESAIREIEAEYDHRPGQHVGPARLQRLRFAVEDYMKANHLKWDSAKPPIPDEAGVTYDSEGEKKWLTKTTT
jgi:hypothetical protein